MVGSSNNGVSSHLSYSGTLHVPVCKPVWPKNKNLTAVIMSLPPEKVSELKQIIHNHLLKVRKLWMDSMSVHVVNNVLMNAEVLKKHDYTVTHIVYAQINIFLQSHLHEKVFSVTILNWKGVFFFF